MIFPFPPDGPVPDAPLNERDLERVIARAREIDALGHEHTRDALHRVAAQLRISPTAIDRALAEVLAGEHTVNDRWAHGTGATRTDGSPSGVRRWLTAASVVIGTVSGLLAGSVYTPSAGDRETIVMVVVLFAVSAGLVWAHRNDRRPFTMMARMAALWSSFGYAWMIGFGQLVNWALETTLIAGGASVVAGTAAQLAFSAWRRFRRRDRGGGSAVSSMIDLFTPIPDSYHTPV